MVEELVDVRGPLLELPTLANIVQCIARHGVDFEVADFNIAKQMDEPSWIRLRVKASGREELSSCLQEITRLGAEVVDAADARLEKVEADGILPADAYALTGLPTDVRANGKWVPVSDPMPNAAVRVDRGRSEALGVPFEATRKGDRVVVGGEGLRVSPAPPDHDSELFTLMGTAVSASSARGPIIVKVAREIERTKGRGQRVALAAGAAVVHSGASGYLEQLIRHGHIDLLIAGSGMAVYDVERALFGTSRGVYVTESIPAVHGAQNTVHALNAIRKAGGLREAVESATLTSGVLHACITSEVPYILVGSVRDEGALPDTITDTVQARQKLREGLKGVGFAMMVASAMLAKAVLLTLPGPVPKVCVNLSDYDINKIVERGAPTVFGIVESAESFLRELARSLGAW
jgi:lysine-ketoglutarate reductase/saccharopine dehydrogenase-like protein (TIGR00300 family)